MDKENLIQFIQRNSPASRSIVADIADEFTECRFVKNEYLVREGKISDSYLYLTDGCMRAFTLDTNGNEVTTNFFLKNRVVFDVSSFFMRIPSTETIQALAPCTGFIITFEQVNRLFHTIPEFREFGRTMLVKEFALFKQRTLALINKSAEERYAELIATNKDIFQYAQLKQIASYLGVTDTSLSRIRREYTRKE